MTSTARGDAARNSSARRRSAVAVGNLRSEILVVQSAQNGHCQHATDTLNGAGSVHPCAVMGAIVEKLQARDPVAVATIGDLEAQRGGSEASAPYRPGG
jgi:hypothetical protein